MYSEITTRCWRNTGKTFRVDAKDIKVEVQDIGGVKSITISASDRNTVDVVRKAYIKLSFEEINQIVKKAIENGIVRIEID